MSGRRDCTVGLPRTDRTDMSSAIVGELERAEARVARAPQDPAGWLAWGELLIGERRFEEARLAMRTATQLAPRDPRSLEGLARALDGDGQPYAAWRALERAVELDPTSCDVAFRLAHLNARLGALDAGCVRMADVARRAPNNGQVHSDLGNLLLRVGHIDRATPHLRRAVEIDPCDANAWIGLGVSHESAGDVDRAERCFRKVLEFAPACGSAWYRLVAIKRHTDIATLERLLAQCDPANGQCDPADGTDRSPLLFALAKLHERAGDHDRAFDCALEANAAAAVDCSPEEIAQVHESAMRTSIARASASSAEVVGARRARMVFVVGLPRTGSTLTESIVARHSQACSVGEFHGICEVLTELQYELARNPGTHETKHVEAMAERYVERLPLDAETRARVARGEITCVDKALGNYLALDWIKLLFPGARIVHTRRDPRDTLLSAFLLPLHRVACASSYDLANLESLYHAHVRVLEHWRSLDFTHIHDVWYEDLVHDHERTVRALIDACGLPWEPDVLDFTKRESVVLTASANQVRDRLYSKSVERWRPFAARLAEHLSPALVNWDRTRVAA